MFGRSTSRKESSVLPPQLKKKVWPDVSLELVLGRTSVI